MRFDNNQWGLILGGSSGLGLASAKKLAAHGLNLILVHRDRRGVMDRIQADFAALRQTGIRLCSINADALCGPSRGKILATIEDELGGSGKLRLLLHSIALGNLKPLAVPRPDPGRVHALERLAGRLGVGMGELDQAIADLFADGLDALHPLVAGPTLGETLAEDEDFAATIYNMGTSLWSWVRDLLGAGLFAGDARVLCLTSEGNTLAWRGYAAVSAAKAVLESLCRAMALELAPYGIRANAIQAGITETPASSLIPGIARLKAEARRRNPLGRLTRPEDVANAVFLLCTDEAAWINGALLRVDGGEHIAGGAS